jgi:hypothetical protein
MHVALLPPGVRLSERLKEGWQYKAEGKTGQKTDTIENRHVLLVTIFRGG